MKLVTFSCCGHLSIGKIGIGHIENTVIAEP